MNTNTYKFGKALLELRQKFNYTQNEVTLLAGTYKNIPGLNTETLRRIERGIVIPKFETLELLSNVYKQDLNALFIECRIDDYYSMHEIKNNINSKLNNNNFCTLTTELEELRIISKNTTNLYYKTFIKQLTWFTEAMTLYMDKKDNNQALKLLIKAMRISTPTFNLSNYQQFTYSSMEIRILMNTALVLNRLNYHKEYKDILVFCQMNLDFNDELFSKLCHNLAGVYRRSKEFSKALVYSNMGIASSQKNNYIDGLNILYYGKGISEYNLGESEYIDSINMSLYLSKAFKQDKAAESIIYNCNNIFDIKLKL